MRRRIDVGNSGRQEAAKSEDPEAQRVTSAMRLYSYVVRWDHGFAPNPFYGRCTVATCKPDIRKSAIVGEYVLGTGSAKRGLAGHAVFLMRVDKIIAFDEYWNDPEYARKIPVMNGSLQQRFGDNIYRHDGAKWIQADSRHSQLDAKENARNVKRDTGKTDKVLIASEFTYWGGDGPVLPASLANFVQKSPGHRSFFSDADIRRFIAWIGDEMGRGVVGDPYEWQFPDINFELQH
jgi:hypothetical protein